MNDLGIELEIILLLVFWTAITVLPSVLLSKTLFKKLKIVYQTLFSFGMVFIFNFILFNKFYATSDFRDHFVIWVPFLILVYFVNLRLDKEEWGKFMKKLYK